MRNSSTLKVLVAIGARLFPNQNQLQFAADRSAEAAAIDRASRFRQRIRAIINVNVIVSQRVFYETNIKTSSFFI